MPGMIEFADASELPLGSSKVFSIAGWDVAVFNVGGKLYAVEDRCPHQGASLGDGAVEESAVACSRHGWKFDLATGRHLGSVLAKLRCFPIAVEGSRLAIDIPETAEDHLAGDGIYRYLVRYGSLGWVGRFGSLDKIDCIHRDRVIVQTARGLEIGEVLRSPESDQADRTPPAGEVVRRITSEDETRARAAGINLDRLFADCRQLISEHRLPIEVIDCEQLLDGETIVFYYLGDPAPELEQFAEDLGRTCEPRITFHPVVEPAPASGGCGAEGCNGGGCGS